MRAAVVAFCTLICVLAGSEIARAGYETSPVPRARPSLFVAKSNVLRWLPVFGPAADAVRPRARPVLAAANRIAPQPQHVRAPMAAYAAVPVSPFPRARPYMAARAKQASYVPRTQPSGIVPARQGAVCGDSKIRGRSLPPIPGRLRGCGLKRPVEVTEIAGVKLSQPSTIDCSTAKALKTWLNKGVKPVVGRKGGGVASLTVAAHYSCRTRNNQPGAKISEHGKGKAIDISAITLNNGLRLSVLNDWGKGAQGKMLRKMHKNACGPFGTVLGPRADRFHKDHFHLDTARHRSGPYCQ